MTWTAVSLLAQGTPKAFYISLEDVFATGFVAEKMGVSRLHETYLLMEQNRKLRLPSYVRPMEFVAAHAHTLQNQRKIWAKVMQKYPQQVPR
ncbi:hypothetical protein RvY_16063 [Ramazzottius varieornatus]|uniref:Hexosyltransferase n=1 Tax=Ramazzottius varieornatus TaxID=947166 RepID=A0A1D1W042_RAMVA|nr:hypothetical protein RvY_16063 [Ramazzottius varieornatus]